MAAPTHELHKGPRPTRRRADATARGARVLVATDLTDASNATLRDAAALARAVEGTLAVVHAMPPARLLRRVLSRGEVGGAHVTKEWLAKLASEAVRDRVAHVGASAEDVFVDDKLEHLAILERAQEWHADVVVVGAGRTAQRVLRRAPCDVLVARPRPSTARGWVLAVAEVPDQSGPVLRRAAAAARRFGASLEVVEPLGFLDVEAAYLIELGSPLLIERDLRTRDLARERLAMAVAAENVDAVCEVVDRPAASSIANEARRIGAELVVVSHRGTLAFSTLAERLARCAPCSVLAVHP
jgi:nucleotide-binding universal stress UspA family protein